MSKECQNSSKKDHGDERFSEVDALKDPQILGDVSTSPSSPVEVFSSSSSLVEPSPTSSLIHPVSNKSMPNTAIVMKHVTRMSTPGSYPQADITEATVSTHEQATATVNKNQSLKNRKFPKIAGNSCPICHKTLCSKTNVRRHILTEHENTMRSQCPKCDKTFASKTSLKYHSKTHFNVTEFVCEKCQETFCSLTSYRSHLKQHNEPKKEKCPKCDLFLMGKRSLSRHLKEVHFLVKYNTDKKKFPVYEFKCEVCDSKYKRHTHLKAHFESQHLGEKLSCDMCGKEYSNLQNLRRHSVMKHKS